MADDWLKFEQCLVIYFLIIALHLVWRILASIPIHDLLVWKTKSDGFGVQKSSCHLSHASQLGYSVLSQRQLVPRAAVVLPSGGLVGERLLSDCRDQYVPPKPQIKQKLQVGLKLDYFKEFWSSVENASPCFKRSSRQLGYSVLSQRQLVPRAAVAQPSGTQRRGLEGESPSSDCDQYVVVCYYFAAVHSVEKKPAKSQQISAVQIVHTIQTDSTQAQKNSSYSEKCYFIGVGRKKC